MRRRLVLPLLIAPVLLLAGCSNRQQQNRNQGSTPFVFQALNLRQQDSRGRLLWNVTSPEARYDLSRRIALARDLRGEIAQAGTPMYRLQASLGTVLNDGEVLQLEGDVRVERLGGDPVLIKASRMRWYPRQERIELDRHAQATSRQLRLNAKRATLLLGRDLLQLRGTPTVETGSLRLVLQQLDWSPGRGELQSTGPAVASQRLAVGQPRTLQAAGLQGNTLQRRLELLGPVLITAPDQKGWLRAQSSSIDLQTDTLRSDRSFEGAMGPLRLSGGGFNVDLKQSRAMVLGGCRVEQPDALLRAGTCSWDWQNRRVHAGGGVELQRRSPQQYTRALQLDGHLGDGGLIVFSSPGSRVRSTLRLPRSGPLKQPPAPAIRL